MKLFNQNFMSSFIQVIQFNSSDFNVFPFLYWKTILKKSICVLL